MSTTIVVAGATGNLGARIARGLVKRGANVRAITRASASADKLRELGELGVEALAVDMQDVAEVARVCTGAACVVSALAGLGDVIVDLQSVLLDASVKAGVPRFIPSDFASDFTKQPGGSNRNFDLRRAFHERLDPAPIRPTSILNGAFADMLFTRMPMVDLKNKRVTYWENADQRMDFTTTQDVGDFAAEAALDPTTPTVLRIAGDSTSARELMALASEMTGQPFDLVCAGSLAELGAMIDRARAEDPDPTNLYPKWQTLQYARGMFSGLGKLEPLDNDRYPGRTWTTTRDLLAAHLRASAVS